MGVVRKIDVTVSEERASEIDAAVDSGEFASAGEVVAAALDAWITERLFQDSANIQRLRRLWDEGIASGPAIEGNFDLADIKRRAAERQQSAADVR